MALNGDQLGIEIAEAVMHPKATPEARVAVTDLYKKIANAIVDHIKTNAEVPTGISVKTADTINGATTEPGKVI